MSTNTDPIIYRSELIQLLQSGGLGNAGTSGSSTLASLNSQLISLTARIAKLEGSSTYDSEQSTTNWEYFEELGLVVASGNLILTQDYTTTQKIPLATIDADKLPLNTEFIGVANVYDSSASEAISAQELRMGFEENVLYAYPESYIEASPTATMYLSFSTMWFPAKDLSSETSNYTRKAYEPNSSYLYQDATKYYIQFHSSGGVHFMCAHLCLKSDARGMLIDYDDFVKSTTWANTSTTTTKRFGRVFRRNSAGDTITQGSLGLSSSKATYINYEQTYNISVNDEIYAYGIAFDKNTENINLGVFENITSTGDLNIGESQFYVRYFKYQTLNLLEFYGRITANLNAWTGLTFANSAKLSKSVSEKNLPSLSIVGSTVLTLPVNITNQKVVMTLKPQDSNFSGSVYINACLLFRHNTSS